MHNSLDSIGFGEDLDEDSPRVVACKAVKGETAEIHEGERDEGHEGSPARSGERF